MKTNLIIALIVLAAIFGYILYVDRKRETFEKEAGGLVLRDLPTSPEVEFIQGTPDTHVVNEVDGTEMIHEGDLTLSPGFGVGEGLVGFGRYGSSFMA